MGPSENSSTTSSAKDSPGDAFRPINPTDLLTSLQSRASALLSELRAYQTHLKLHQKQNEVEIKIFKRGVESEVKSLKKVGQAIRISDVSTQEGVHPGEDGGIESPLLHALRSSNLPFYEAVWDVAKSSRYITALGKNIYVASKYHISHEGKASSITHTSTLKEHRKKRVLVDIVAENGLEWTKVSTLTEKRLLFEMAKEGWETYADYSDGTGSDTNGRDAADQEERAGKLELVRVAEDLKVASQGVRIQFRHPRIRFVLPKIREGALDDVDAFLADLRATGATVQCGLTVEDTENKAHLSHASSNMDFDLLVPAAAPVLLTNRVNVDCTILLALVSDISHQRRNQLCLASTGKSGTYHGAILRQIEAEESSPLLPKEVYPLLSGRNLECTFHAAQRMREIVQCMGTTSERIRADIVLGEDVYRSQSASALRQALTEQSIHDVPAGIQFPIKVVNFDADKLFASVGSQARPNDQRSKGFPFSIAARAKESFRLTPINSSVFIYGWVQDMVTLTSNRTVASGLLGTINKLLDEGEQDETQKSEDDKEFIGPSIYVCETARSLVGKAKSEKESQ